ncbi:MAG: oligosaccharide flippase family protein [Pseudomonadota bacterium]|nr:oligosaccharide flippase family protein [Pseudomonadota bacterium]
MNLLSMFRGDGLRGRSMRSSFFTVLNMASQNLLRLGGNLVLTRLLFPEAFGIMALVQVVMSGLQMFSDIGVGLSIVQNKRGGDPDFLNSAWVLQIGRGTVLWIAAILLAAPVANFYDAPILAQLLPVAGLTALIQGFNSTKLATANRNLALGRVTMIRLGANAVGLLVLIALAFWLQSVWALVLGGLVAPLIVMVLSHTALPGHRNRFRLDRSAIGELTRFGKYIFLSTIAGFLTLQSDRAILGKLVSLSDLALYNIAFMLATLPRMLQQSLVNQVLYALYANRPPTQSDENYRDIAKARFMVIAVALAIASVLAVGGNHLIILLYDPRYEAAGVLLVLMAIAALPGLISTCYNNAVLATGNSRRFAFLVAMSAILQLGVLVVGVSQFGVIGAALSPFVSSLLFYPIQLVTIRPYRAWVPRQDVIFGLAGCAIAAVAVWVNYDALLIGLEQFLPQ